MRIFTALLIAGLSVSAQAQQALPKGLSAQEEKIVEDYFKNYTSTNRGITTAPTGDLRTMAEWEEIQALFITWTGQFDDIQSQIVDAAQEECEVCIVCDDSSQVKGILSGNGVPLTNLAFIEADYNSIWVRDYAGNSVYKNDVDSLLMVDWIYNRPRPDDDVMPDLHGQYYGVDVYETTVAPTDLVNTGGNWMVDGHGTAFASELILDENDFNNPYSVSVKSETDIDNIVDDWMGIDRYIKMPVLPYDQIHHIDMHMKLLDEETLLVSEYPNGVADGPQIEANLQYVLSNFNSMFGTPYKVVRITVPPSTGGLYPDNGGYYRTYSNNVFVNKTVLLPTYRQQYDTTAIRTLEEALPGYTIVPIDVDNQGENLISLSGAIHCITHSLGVDDPLLITHQSLEDTYDDVNPYVVNAEVKHRSGISGATLYYTTTQGGSYTSVPMTNTTADDWTASIPAQSVGTTVYYYVEGDANNGKTQVRPIVAPQGYWDFMVLDSGSIGIHETQGVELLDVFPNPANAITCIPVTSLKATSATITLRDVTGKVVEEVYQGDIPMGESKYFINAANYAAGSYLVVVQTGNSTITKKLMIR